MNDDDKPEEPAAVEPDAATTPAPATVEPELEPVAEEPGGYLEDELEALGELAKDDDDDDDADDASPIVTTEPEGELEEQIETPDLMAAPRSKRIEAVGEILSRFVPTLEKLELLEQARAVQDLALQFVNDSAELEKLERLGVSKGEA
jgi:hypothetical protein